MPHTNSSVNKIKGMVGRRRKVRNTDMTRDRPERGANTKVTLSCAAIPESLPTSSGS